MLFNLFIKIFRFFKNMTTGVCWNSLDPGKKKVNDSVFLAQRHTKVSDSQQRHRVACFRSVAFNISLHQLTWFLNELVIHRLLEKFVDKLSSNVLFFVSPPEENTPGPVCASFLCPQTQPVQADGCPVPGSEVSFC